MFWEIQVQKDRRLLLDSFSEGFLLSENALIRRP